jgi:signal transduction histidine kinase
MTTSRPTAAGAAIGLEELAEAVNRAGHDLNNLCASILGFAALTRESLDPSSPLHEYLAEVLASAEKTAALAEHLRRLARAARPESSDGAIQGAASTGP